MSALPPGSPPPELQRFVDARHRPAAFFFTGDEYPLFRSHVISLHDAVHGHNFEELDLVIHSGGGIAHSAYQVVELLRFHTKQLNACVPFWAKSAATLLCMGADKIVVGEHAELGPLDVQMYEERKAGKGTFTSALNPFKSLEQLVAASVEALAAAMRFIVEEYEMSYDESLPHAVAFVGQTTGPLVSRLDPDKLGQYNRELSVAIEYGRRLLTRYRGLSHSAAGDLVERLVYGYPSHEYIIDYRELETLGFDVSLFPEGDEREAATALLPVADSGQRIVEVMEPTAAPAKPSETSEPAVTKALAGLVAKTQTETGNGGENK